MSRPDHTAFLLEDMNAKFDAILEIVIPIRHEVTEIKKKVAHIPAIEADIQAIKVALTATNTQVRGHERRLSALESKAL